MRDESSRRFPIFEGAPDMVASIDLETEKLLTWNLALVNNLGYDTAPWVGGSVLELCHPASREQTSETLDSFRRTGQAPDAEVQLLRKNGRALDVRMRVMALSSPPGTNRQVISIWSDVSPLEHARAHLLRYRKRFRSFASEIALAGEQERRRIAAELHDRIVQDLSVAKLHLEQSGASAGSASSGSRREVRTLIDGLIRDTRQLAYEFNPPGLRDRSLATAIGWLAGNFEKRHKLACTTEIVEPTTSPVEEVRVVLFQAARELLANVAQHAGALHVGVSLEQVGESVRLRIEDDGAGFDVSSLDAVPDDNGGFGLLVIQDRLDLLGGELRIESKPGGGTRVTATAPCKASRGLS